MKLIDSIKFGKTLKKKTDAEYRLLRDNYDNFLLQPLTLGMFIPCDNNENFLKEPKEEDFLEIPFDFDGKIYNLLFKEYKEAQSKVIFKGLFFRNCGKNKFSIETLKYDYVFNSKGKNNNLKIEDLISYNLDLAVSF